MTSDHDIHQAIQRLTLPPEEYVAVWEEPEDKRWSMVTAGARDGTFIDNLGPVRVEGARRAVKTMRNYLDTRRAMLGYTRATADLSNLHIPFTACHRVWLEAWDDSGVTAGVWVGGKDVNSKCPVMVDLRPIASSRCIELDNILRRAKIWSICGELPRRYV